MASVLSTDHLLPHHIILKTKIPRSAANRQTDHSNQIQPARWEDDSSGISLARFKNWTFLGRTGHGAAAAGRRGGGPGGRAARAGARDRAGVLAAGLRRPPQLLPRLQAMVPRLCGATGRVEKGVPGGLEPAGSQLQVRDAVALPDLLHQKPENLVPLTLLLSPSTRQSREPELHCT